ncbi:MAG: glycosyltransferase, partial [Pseudomonadota bacterium]
IRDWKPDVVVGFGGYPSFPALRAAESVNVPRVIHEQNAVLGRVNRVFARKATVVASGFEALARLPQGATHVVVGNPLRDTLLQAAPKPNQSSKTNAKKNILIVGGSLGANILSDIVPTAIVALDQTQKKGLSIVQQATASRLDSAKQTYADANISATVETFFTDIHDHLAHADLIIARAGASSVSE